MPGITFMSIDNEQARLGNQERGRLTMKGALYETRNALYKVQMALNWLNSGESPFFVDIKCFY